MLLSNKFKTECCKQIKVIRTLILHLYLNYRLKSKLNHAFCTIQVSREMTSDKDWPRPGIDVTSLSRFMKSRAWNPKHTVPPFPRLYYWKRSFRGMQAEISIWMRTSDRKMNDHIVERHEGSVPWVKPLASCNRRVFVDTSFPWTTSLGCRTLTCKIRQTWVNF